MHERSMPTEWRMNRRVHCTAVTAINCMQENWENDTRGRVHYIYPLRDFITKTCFPV